MQVLGDLRQRVQGGHRGCDREQVLGLQFGTGARPETRPEVRQPVIPAAGHAELLGARVRRPAGHRVPLGLRGGGSEPWFVGDF